jgi:sugar diacid utilization regulator
MHVVASASHPDEALLRVARQTIEDRSLARKPVPQALHAPVEVAHEDLSVLLMPASLGQGVLGIVVAGVEADLVTDASSMVADLSQLVVIELFAQDRIAQDMEADEREVFLDLVDGRSLGRIIDRAARLGCDLTVGHLPVACRLVRPSRHTSPERQMGCLRTILFETARDGGGLGIPRLLCGQTEKNELLAFVPISDEKEADALTRGVLRGTASLGAIVTIGVGPISTSPAAFARNALRARWTARILELTGNPQRVVSFDDLGVYALLFDPAKPTELDAFVNRWIGPLIEYDREQNTQLRATLEAILEGRGQRQTAEKLVIHLSTLKYRVRRIHEILGLDYHDPDVSFNLQLAIRIFSARHRFSMAVDERGEPAGPWVPLSSTC